MTRAPRWTPPPKRRDLDLPPPERNTRPVTMNGGVKPAPKPEPAVRSEAYRRLVAALPCKACGRLGCQAAHPNTGKGMGMKTDDRLCFPLCPDCHTQFDQGAMFPKAVRREIELTWAADTRRQITAAGDWPANLPPVATHPALLGEAA